MTPDVELPRLLAKGANIGLRELDAALGSVTVVLESGGRSGKSVSADVSVLLLGDTGKVTSDQDLVFYNQPVAVGGAVHLRDKVVTEHPVDGSVEKPEILSADTVTLELDSVPDDIARIVLAASLDPDSGSTFGDASTLSLRLQRTADAQDILRFDIDGASTETALLFGEFYRRDGDWRVRAVGQGYDGGLAALVADHGIEVDDQAAADTDDGDPTEKNPAQAQPSGTTESERTESRDAEEMQQARKRISVRRPVRAPRMPADWNATIPTPDGTDWHPARLFPVAGIGGAEEQERRATSSLLAVMVLVKEFGRVLTTRCGAPAGAMETFVEVPFGHDEAAYRPDGVIRVKRGAKVWQALVEVKTSTNALRSEQVDNYVDIARDKGYDAVVTISNELSGTEDGPVTVDRRKLRKVALVHLSWDRIRTDALLLLKKDGVADATQRRVLAEFVRYLQHSRSGLQGFQDMGPRWVGVREAVKAKTLRSGDKNTAEVSNRFDQLMQHVAFSLSALLGVEVRAQPPREAPDVATRCQQLADSGLLFGTLRIPGAVAPLVVSADLRTERVACSVRVDAPRDGKPLTRIRWLLRQLPADARDAVRVEALLAGHRGDSTAALLAALRKDPEVLLPSDSRDIRGFTVAMEAPSGSKRASVQGGLIASVQHLTTSFYVEVVQNLTAWNGSAPRMSRAPEATADP